MTITARLYPTTAHESADRHSLRQAERELEREVRRAQPDHGRLWSRHNPGILEICRHPNCGRLGNLWVGSYQVYEAAPRVTLPPPPPGSAVPPYAIHSSDPLCAFHAIELQRAEWRVPIWRPSWVHEAIGHA